MLGYVEFMEAMQTNSIYVLRSVSFGSERDVFYYRDGNIYYKSYDRYGLSMDSGLAYTTFSELYFRLKKPNTAYKIVPCIHKRSKRCIV